MRKWFVALVAIALTACSQPYDPPAVFDETFSAANGAASEAPSQGFTGLKDLAQLGAPEGGSALPLRVLWTHGMCSPPDGTDPHDPYVWWQVRTNDLLAAWPGALQTTTPPVIEHLPSGAQLIKQSLTVPGGTAGTTRAVELWFFDWSPITAPFKPRRIGDIEARNGSAYTYDRATVNRALKQNLVKDCLADVVVYLGVNGDPIRSDAQIALCEMLDGKFDAELGCAGASGRRFTAMISESLGSTVLFDAFRSLRLDYVSARKNAIARLATNAPAAMRAARARARKPDTSMNAYRANMASANTAMGRAQENSNSVSVAMASLTSFYMLANQIPLLGFAKERSLEEFVSGATAMRKPDEAAAALTVVAFLDPNDLLSFRLVPGSNRAHVVDFVVSNADTYLGYAELPTSAHCNYIRNGYVMHAIVAGYGGGRPQSGPIDDPEPNCL
jgi:hypothetical protein